MKETDSFEAVLESMDRLVVDEIEEDGSGMWTDSSMTTPNYS